MNADFDLCGCGCLRSEHNSISCAKVQEHRCFKFHGKWFVCVVCTKPYEFSKTRADYRGFCSARCQHTLEKIVGYDPKRSKFGGVAYERFFKESRKRRNTLTNADHYEK